MDNRGDDGGPVAIIGVACRFPGAAEPAEFHDLMVAGRRMFRPAAGAPGGPLYAALLDDWVRPTWSGDPAGGTPDTGPVQKLAAETTALALADAGFRDVAGMPPSGDGRRRGGGGRRRNPDGMQRRAGGRDGPCDRAGLFLASSVAGVGSLVREQFGFAADVPQPGPAATSSLHAVAAAAAALGAGDLDLAVAGGAELGLDPAWLTAQARAGTLGRDEMRVYAADPAGRLPGEGCGIVVLARSADARAAGLPVYAEIAGWSTMPVSSSSLDGQTVLRAYRQAGIDPADIQFIEGEGTGTAAGDLAELTAFAQLRRGGQVTAALGAAAASIGYTRAAAGIASLLKTALAMAVGVIPPGPGNARQHPLIESGDALLRLPRRPEPWPDQSVGTSGLRLAAVNSLGTADPAAEPGPYGLREAEGVHLVLGREAESDRSRGRRRRRTAEAATGPAPATTAADPPAARAELTWHSEGRPSVFALCGEDASGVAGRLVDLAEGATALSAGDLRGLARELAADVQRASDRAGPHRTEMVRVALTAATPAQLAVRARAAARRLSVSAAGAAGDPDVYVSVGAGGRVVVLFGGLAGPGLSQSARLAGSLAGLRTLDGLGVTPGAAVGYSLGEITGLVWAGCLPAAEAARLVAQCGQVLRGCTCGPAAMARVAADAETARGLGAPDRLHIAAYEGARSHVLAGSTAGIRNLARRAAAAGVAVELLGLTQALHSPAMARCTAPLKSVFAGTRFAPPRQRLISTITGRPVMPGDNLAGLLAGQLTRPVLFAQAMALAAEGADLIAIAGADDGLAGLAAGPAAYWGAVPCVAVPGGAGGQAGAGQAGADRGGGDPSGAGPGGGDPSGGGLGAARAVAALFAAGAISNLGPLAPLDSWGRRDLAGPGGTRDGPFVPRMRDGESTGPIPAVR